MKRTADASLHSLYRLDKSIPHCQQERSVPAFEEDWLYQLSRQSFRTIWTKLAPTACILCSAQCSLRWLGHMHRMDDGRILKDITYGELVSGQGPTGHPALRYKDVCKYFLHDMHRRRQLGVSCGRLQYLETGSQRKREVKSTVREEKEKENQAKEPGSKSTFKLCVWHLRQ